MRFAKSAMFSVVMLAASSATVLTQTSTPGQVSPGAAAKRGRGKELDAGLFRGITLSAAERERVRAVDAKYEPEFKTLRRQDRPNTKAIRDTRQRGDTAALRSLRQTSLQERQQAAALTGRMRSDLRAALTPENQATFDANLARVEKRSGKHAGRAAKGHAVRQASYKTGP